MIDNMILKKKQEYMDGLSKSFVGRLSVLNPQIDLRKITALCKTQVNEEDKIDYQSSSESSSSS